MLDVGTVMLIIGLLGTLVPLGLGIGCSTLWWKNLRRPGIFMLVGVFAMFGLRAFFERLAFFAHALVILVSPSTFGPDHAEGGTIPMLRWELGQAIFVAMLTAFLGYVLLRAAMSAQVKS